MSYFISIFLKLGTYVDFVYIYIPVKFCVIHMKGNWVIKKVIIADAEHIGNVAFFALLNIFEFVFI